VTIAHRSVADLLLSAAANAASRPAIADAGRVTTYAELLDRASSIATSLKRRGIQAGDRVAILGQRDASSVCAYFGALAAGAVVTIVNERLRPRQIEYVLDRCNARICLASSNVLAEHPRPLASTAAILDLTASGRADLPARTEPAPETLAQIIFTSGSTGLPKGVVFSHRAMLEAIRVVVAYLGLRRDERILSALPFSSVYGLNQLLCAVATGSTLVISRSTLAASIADEAAQARVTMISAVPPLWLQLLATPAFRRNRIGTLRIMQNAGGHLPVDAVRQLRATQPQARLFLQYGMTETFRSTYLPPEEVDECPDSMGRPVPGSTIWVVGEDGQICQPGEVGELVFQGPTMSDGYWKDPAMTASVFRAAPVPARGGGAGIAVYSGDVVRTDASGRLFYVSRRDRVIKSLGFRIGPDEITDVLYASGEIVEAAIRTEPDAIRGERIIAYVVLRPEGSRTRLERFVRFELPRHMQPAVIDTRDELPRLPSGKYDLDTLRENRLALVSR
jgi:acyl-CoA synthetase (AMP-forming)/AMP-acid ligase II